MAHTSGAFARWQSAIESAERAALAQDPSSGALFYAHLANSLRALLLDEVLAAEALAHQNRLTTLLTPTES